MDHVINQQSISLIHSISKRVVGKLQVADNYPDSEPLVVEHLRQASTFWHAPIPISHEH